MTTLETLTEITAEAFGVPAAELSPDRDLRGIDGVDSVKVLRAIARIEQRYDVELEDSDVFAVKTLGDLVTLIEKAQ
ncbi:acyl carrier protein [Longispora albida]|uniref:acyl carrier protein n=1 Tax=Longispora albida TaxID=203523 RepID=UPI0003608965|nr:acyl carrier protein [Longispora albida]